MNHPSLVDARPRRIRVIAVGHIFLDGTYDDITKGQTCEFILMGESEGDVSLATGDQASGISAGPTWITDVVADIEIAPPGQFGDGIYLMNAGAVSFLLIGRLRDLETGRNMAAGDRIDGRMTLNLNAGEYLDLLPPKTQVPVHVCRVDRIQIGERGLPSDSRSETYLSMHDIVWRDIHQIRFRDASRFELVPYYMLECQITAQKWKEARWVLDALSTP